ncbi:hypothetical protein Dcar01_01842 [Deinococcus carri]|uniref:Integrase catalytic domain-containing protein n=1 Tax=Deinococcus carri TaxID=1211323 RepID=A0ABP9W7L7_9DEIO
MASPYAFEFRPGTRLHLRGDSWTVSGLTGTHVTLRDALGRETPFETLEVLQDPTFFPILSEREMRRFDPRAVILDTYPEPIVAAALELEAHLLEYRTGYRSGEAATAAPGEPRDAYHPGLVPLQQRLQNKACELVAARPPGLEKKRRLNARAEPDPVLSEMERLRKLYREYQKVGLIALIDRRVLRRREGHGRHHPAVVKAAQREIHRQVSASSRSLKNLALHVRLSVEDQHGKNVPVQGPRSLQRLIKRLGKARRLENTASTRRSHGRRPQGVYLTLVATFPGEYVLIDVTLGDFLAIDPLTLTSRRYQLVAAMDLYSRCILSFRLLPDDPKGIDLVFSLYDIITPKRMLPGWPEAAAYPYVGVPRHVVLRAHGLPEDTALAGIPSVTPHAVVVDNGRIFVSAPFTNGCRLLNVSILQARPYTPTDKSQLERWFGTMERGFAQHLGSYLSYAAHERGEKREEEATHFVHEIESRLGEWIATVYHRQIHSELRSASVPGADLSPNDMFDLGISKAGLVTVPLGQDIYYQLLETIDRKINTYGIEYRGLLYDHEALNEFRDLPSDYGHLRGKWPFKRDPRDLRYLYWQHPRTLAWHRLTRRDSAYPDAPFSSELLRRARLIALKQGGRLHDPEEASRALDSLVRGIRQETRTFKQRRRQLAEERALLQSERDRETVLPQEPIQTPPPPPAAPAVPPAVRNYRSLDRISDDWMAAFDLEEDPT